MDENGWPICSSSEEDASCARGQVADSKDLLKEAEENAKNTKLPGSAHELRKFAAANAKSHKTTRALQATISIGTIKLETYKQKSYIRTKVDGPWKLLCNLADTTCSKHAAVMKAVFEDAVRDDHDKYAMLHSRDEYVNDLNILLQSGLLLQRFDSSLAF